MTPASRLERRVIESYRRGNDYRWVACLAASRIVGKHDGETKRLAGELALSLSQVENLAGAGKLYRALRPFGVMCEIRKRTTPSHFSAMWELANKHKLTNREVWEQLRTAAETGASVVTMRINVEGEHGNSDNPTDGRLPVWTLGRDPLPDGSAVVCLPGPASDWAGLFVRVRVVK